MMVVNAHPKNGRWATALSWLAGATALMYALSRFLPLPPQFHNSNLDNSWMQVLHLAFERHWQFGRDIVFTYGPWGFLCGGYSPPTFAVSVIVWAMLSLVFWRAGWRLACPLSDHQLVSWFWLMGFIAVTGLSVKQSIDLRLAVWSVLLLLLHFFVEDRSITPIQTGLVVSFGVLSLTKFTGLVEAAIVVVIIAADNVFRQKRFPWLALLFVTSVLFFWVAAGQNPDGLGPFLRNSWRITDGYTEAMTQVGEEETRDVGGFLLAAALLVALTGYVAWKRHRYWGTLPITGLGFILFLIFKQGYVRYDDEHTVKAALALLATALACLAVTWPVLRREKPWLGVAGLYLLAGILYFSSSTFRGWYPKNGLQLQLARTFGATNVLAPAKLLQGTDCWQKDNETYLRQIRTVFPVPPLEGNADVYPWNQATLLAHGLAYHPRPVIQSYSAYTPELVELNAAFLRSDQAASNILFEIRLVDDRFPSLNDGRSWPELLTRYDVKDITGTFVILKRSATPRPFQLKPFQDRPFHFGEPIPLPATNHGPLWAEMEINQSVWGVVVSTLYKPPVLTLAVSLRDGRQLRFRLVPGMARSGFLLSPLVNDNASFVALAAADGGRNLADAEVASVTLSADTPSGSTACYQSPLRLHLYHLDYPRQDLNGMAAGSATPPIPLLPEKPGKTN
jgi:hypothetical protein